MPDTAKLLCRHVTVQCRPGRYALDATGCVQHVTAEALAAMPFGQSGEVDVFFFKPEHLVNDEDIEQEYAARGLKPASPYALAAVNEADRDFATAYPSCTHFRKGISGWPGTSIWYIISFRTWNGERTVTVERSSIFGSDDWFAGVPA